MANNDAAILAEIAKLDKALNRARQPAPKPTPAAQPTRSTPSTHAYKTHPYQSPPPFTQHGSRNKKLVLSVGPSGASSLSATASGSRPSTSAVSSSSNQTWVKRSSGNLSLMNAATYDKTEKARLARPPPPSASNSVAAASRSRQVVIDGVTFEFDASGTKLNKIEGQSDSPNPLRRTFFAGQDYRRTKSGNLIQAAVVRRRRSSGTSFGAGAKLTPEELVRKKDRLGNMTLVLNTMQQARNDQRPKTEKELKAAAKREKKAKTLCLFYTRTGRCNNALSCPYLHDATKLSICRPYLRSACPNTRTSCPLSHDPSPHNAPACVHFQSSGRCRAGDSCPYTHVRVSPDAPVCGDFVKYGWCERGAECPERHVWECKEWSEKGTCRRGGKCGLKHVLRAEAGRLAAAIEQQTEGEEEDEEGRDASRARDADDDEEEVARSLGGGTARPVTKPRMSSGIQSLVQQDDFIEFGAFGGTSDEEEDDEDDDDDSSVDSEEERIVEDSRATESMAVDEHDMPSRRGELSDD